MQLLKPLEPGVVFWGERDNLAEIRSLGVRCGQLVTPGSMPLNEATFLFWRNSNPCRSPVNTSSK